MTKIRLAAIPEHFLHDPRLSGLSRVGLVGGEDIAAPVILEAANLAAITRAVADYGASVAEKNPGVSFHIYLRVAKGERKPRGFDAADFGVDAWMKTYSQEESDTLMRAAAA